jgi:glyoxylase I family protein
VAGRSVDESFDGGCLCGAVRYRATGAPTSPTLCHCTSCRRAAGAPAVAWMTFAPERFDFVRGEPVRFRSSPPVTRSFCGRCGTPLTYVHEAFAGVDVTTASLDAPERCPPADHTWTSERLPWWRPEPRWPEFPRRRAEGGSDGNAEAIGLDHAYLTVSDLGRAKRFYDGVLAALGFRSAEEPIGSDPHVHYWNRALQLSLRPSRAAGSRHDPYAPGLHHLCLQVRSRADVDAAHAALRALGIDAAAPRLYPEYNPDYYATFFSDPDGIRLEVVARKAKRDEIVARWETG